MRFPDPPLHSINSVKIALIVQMLGRFYGLAKFLLFAKVYLGGSVTNAATLFSFISSKCFQNINHYDQFSEVEYFQ